MVPGAFDDRDRPRIPDREPVARLTGRVQLAGGRAVQDRVADDQVLVRRVGVRGPTERPDDELTAAQPLAHVVVRLALELEVHAASGERAEALSRAPRETEPYRPGGEPGVAVALRDHPGHSRADRQVMVVDRVVAREGQSALQVRLEVGQDFRVE